MNKPRLTTSLLAFLLAAIGQPGGQAGSANHLRATETALDRYVGAPDPSYEWKLVNRGEADGCRFSVIDLASQTWLTTKEVDRPTWRHWLTIIAPKEVAHSTGLLLIGGGSNEKAAPDKPSGEHLRIAKHTKSVVAELKMVPNQPLVFGGDGRQRTEDDLIAYTWDKYLRTGDERWPARLPMTKAAVRAMDTVTAFCASGAGGAVKVETFLVAGGSKRGWTTWTTAAVDKRVVAICPIVIDVLNVIPSFIHHFQAYGFYAPAVDDYVRAGIMERMGLPAFPRLMELVEPYEYRDRLKMPKLLLNACGDQFFLPDSSQFYFRDLQGVKYLRYIPNADHSLRDSDAVETLLAWHFALLNKRPLPRFSWSHHGDDTIRVRAIDKPAEVKLWQATNPETRDFRLDTIGDVWRARPLEETENGAYFGKVTKPSRGWTAWMVELTYTVGAPTPLKLTTDVRVIPETLPFDPPEPDRQPKP